MRARSPTIIRRPARQADFSCWTNSRPPPRGAQDRSDCANLLRNRNHLTTREWTTNFAETGNTAMMLRTHGRHVVGMWRVWVNFFAVVT